MKYTVYILESTATPRTYVGYTANLKQRLIEHNHGKVKATKSLKPWRILYSESCKNLQEAKQREKYWKSGAGRRKLKKIFSEGSRLAQ